MKRDRGIWFGFVVENGQQPQGPSPPFNIQVQNITDSSSIPVDLRPGHAGDPPAHVLTNHILSALAARACPQMAARKASLVSANEAMLAAAFEIFDTDGNGCVDLGELKSAFPDTSSDEVEKLFAEVSNLIRLSPHRGGGAPWLVARLPP